MFEYLYIADFAEEMADLERENREYKEFLIEQGIYGPQLPQKHSSDLLLSHHSDDIPF